MYKFLKDKTVLYIEDEQDIRENVTELLSDYFLDFLRVLYSEVDIIETTSQKNNNRLERNTI